MSTGIVYILKFDAPIGTARHSAQFYVGWCKKLSNRVARHRAGNGAAITAHLVRVGIGFSVVFSCVATPELEKEIKRYKSISRWLKSHAHLNNPSLVPV